MSADRAKSYHHGSLRHAMIEAALRLIDEHGVDGFSLAQAAREAGVSVAAPYRHFANKRALLNEVAIFGFDELGQRLRAIDEARSGDDVADLIDLGLGYLDFAADRPALFVVMFVNRGRDPQSVAGLAALSVLGDAVARVAAAGRLAVPVEVAVPALWSQVHGLAMLRLGGMRTITERDDPKSRRAVLTPLLHGGILSARSE
ncbi:TetR/AcrR family transcriptional regulator [Microlunatus speluncae]|uniref:TetR/AcrR family transcriptional regulator n=1 Tax=Microlunatus speluncae TaxID=2594267 RepID=UPI00137617FF|nr:TetR/AcrR family transcriptional regulator [Microlunatus speluncae]